MKKVAIKFADINIIPYLCTRFKTLSKFFKYGEMAEWSNAPVLKTGVLRGTGGSNPSLSATEGVCQNDASSFFTNKAPTFTSQGFVMSKRFCTFRH